MVQSSAEKTRDVFCTQCTNKDVISMHQQGCHLDSSAGSISPLDQQKRLLPDSVTAAKTIPEAGHCSLATIRDYSSPFLGQIRSFWVLKRCSKSNFFSSRKTRLGRVQFLNAGKKNLAFFGAVCQRVEQKVGVS